MDLKSLTSLINLSENIKETNEGYLLCCDVWLTMIGELFYGKDEYPEPEFVPDANNMIKIVRTADALNNAETIGSFVGKPVTFNHPVGTFVTVDNWKEYSVGTIVNPRFNGQAIVADLLITDPACVDLVVSKSIRQVSAGVEYIPHFLDDGVCVATQIRGNHVALVKEGRAGTACSIVDSKQGASMGSIKKQLISLLSTIGVMVQQADDEETTSVAKDEFTSKEDKEKNDIKDNKKAKDMDESNTDDDVVEDSKKSKDSDEDEEMTGKYVSKDEFKSFADDMKSMIKDAFEMKKEDKKEVATDSVKVADEVMVKAEVICPGIRPQHNIKRVALDMAYGTQEGKEIIDVLATDGVTESNVDMLFNCTYAMLKDKRKSLIADSLGRQRAANDTSDLFAAKTVNKMCEDFWANKGVK